MIIQNTGPRTLALTTEGFGLQPDEVMTVADELGARLVRDIADIVEVRDADEEPDETGGAPEPTAEPSSEPDDESEPSAPQYHSAQ